jgi:hypothetical protein
MVTPIQQSWMALAHWSWVGIWPRSLPGMTMNGLTLYGLLTVPFSLRKRGFKNRVHQHSEIMLFIAGKGF